MCGGCSASRGNSCEEESTTRCRGGAFREGEGREGEGASGGHLRIEGTSIPTHTRTLHKLNVLNVKAFDSTPISNTPPFPLFRIIPVNTISDVVIVLVEREMRGVFVVE